jgi:hypothetical protein
MTRGRPGDAGLEISWRWRSSGGRDPYWRANPDCQTGPAGRMDPRMAVFRTREAKCPSQRQSGQSADYHPRSLRRPDPAFARRQENAGSSPPSLVAVPWDFAPDKPEVRRVQIFKDRWEVVLCGSPPTRKRGTPSRLIKHSAEPVIFEDLPRLKPRAPRPPTGRPEADVVRARSVSRSIAAKIGGPVCYEIRQPGEFLPPPWWRAAPALQSQCSKGVAAGGSCSVAGWDLS